MKCIFIGRLHDEKYNSSTIHSDLNKPIEFIVSGNLPAYNTIVEEYSTTDNGSQTTTPAKTSMDMSGYYQTKIHDIKPFDQVDLILQPENSMTSSSSSKVLKTNIGLDSNHAPYFVLSLHDQTIREGQSVLFEVIVSGKY